MHVFCAGEQEGTEEEAHTHKLEPALPALPWLFPVVQTFSSSGNVMDEKTNRLTGDGAEMCLSKQKTKKKKIQTCHYCSAVKITSRYLSLPTNTHLNQEFNLSFLFYLGQGKKMI